MSIMVKVLGLGCAALAAALAPTGARAQSADADLKAFAVHINRAPQQPWPGYGIYLGNGLILTAAHVPGNVALTKPHVVIAGQDLPAANAPHAALRACALRRRSGRRRHPGRNGPLQGSASASNSDRTPRAVRH